MYCIYFFCSALLLFNVFVNQLRVVVIVLSGTVPCSSGTRENFSSSKIFFLYHSQIDRAYKPRESCGPVSEGSWRV